LEEIQHAREALKPKSLKGAKKEATVAVA
jgi:hypothetical protein